MKRYFLIITFILTLTFSAIAQRMDETFTGTLVSIGSGRNTRNVTTNFSLNITGRTADAEAQRFLGLLQNDGQDALQKELGKEDLGRFSVGPNVGVRINGVRENIVDGKRRILVVFERWTQFAEFRGGYRSLDYPFGVVELHIDPATGKGDGTYIAAARIRWRDRNKEGRQEIEIENFATFPARLLGVISNRALR